MRETVGNVSAVPRPRMTRTITSSSREKPAARGGVSVMRVLSAVLGKRTASRPYMQEVRPRTQATQVAGVLVPAAGLSSGGSYTARDPLALRPAVTGGLPSGTELRIEARQKPRLLSGRARRQCLKHTTALHYALFTAKCGTRQSGGETPAARL